VRQIRLGTAADTRGTAFVVYEDIHDAKAASDHLNGFNVCGRYLVVLYYQVRRSPARLLLSSGLARLGSARLALVLTGY
jgi:pre-mRNA branch site protein p14